MYTPINNNEGRLVVFRCSVTEGLGAGRANSVTEGLSRKRLSGSSVTEGLGAGCIASVTEGLLRCGHSGALVRVATVQRRGP